MSTQAPTACAHCEAKLEEGEEVVTVPTPGGEATVCLRCIEGIFNEQFRGQ